MPISEKGDKMAKKGYKFTNKNHSQKSVMGTFFGALSVISMIVLIYLSYLRAGEVPVNYGIAVILILIFSGIGMTLSVMAMKEREKFKGFAIAGIVLNALGLISVSAVLFAGSQI
jgi:heme/copper-type cytochrome/quinol oxidase subunit 3